MREFFEKRVWGNPQISRQLRSGFTGPRLGVSFLVLNVVLGITHFALYLTFTESSGTELATSADSVVFFWHCSVVLGLLCVLLPIKIAGFIEGPRIDRSFDQVVSTGISPLRFYVGSWVIGLVYAAIILLLTVPYAGCMIAVCDVSVASMAWGYWVLFAYSNVIIATTLALSVFGREWMSTPIAIIALLTLGLFGLIPDRDWVTFYPTQLAELTPMRALWQHARPWHAIGLGSWVASDPFVDPHFFSTQIPLETFRWLLWSAVVAIGAILCCVGPLHSFRPGLNSFGSVILDGDNKKSRFRRLRGGLTRKVELAFFYENGPEWARRWGAPIRSLLAGLVLITCWAMTLGMIYGGAPSAKSVRFFSDEPMLISFMFNSLVLAAWVLAVAGSRFSVEERVPFGRWLIPRELLTVTLFVLWCSALFGSQYLTLQGVLANTATGAFAGSPPGVQELYLLHWWRFIPATLIVIANIFVLSRLLSLILSSHLMVKIATAALGLAWVVGPMVLAEISRGEQLPEAFMSLIPLSPLVLVDQIREIPWSIDERWTRFLTVQGTLACVMLAGHVAIRIRRTLRARRSSVTAVVSAAVLLLACGLAPEARAQDGARDGATPASNSADAPIVLEQVHRGFEGHVFAPRVDFYTVVVHNRSTAAVKGTYWIEAFDGRDGEKRSFELSAGARKVLRWRITEDPRRWYGRSNFNQVVFKTGSHTVTSQELPLNVPRRVVRSGPQTHEQWLLVGEITRLPDGWAPTTVGTNRTLAHCLSLALPLSGDAYRGVVLVLLSPRDLEKLEPDQRLALYEFVRLGGSVVLNGRYDAEVMRGLPIWGELLTTENSSRPDDHPTIERVQLREGSVAVTGQSESGAVPVLTVRPVGAGSISYLGTRINGKRAPLASTDPKLWGRLDDALPRSRGPLLVQAPYGSERNADRTSFLYPFAYFALYAGVLGGLLFFYCRRQVARWKFWTILLGAPVGFLAFIPTLEHTIHRNPSHAEQVEVQYFQSGSSHGLVTSSLSVGSSGRQEHRVTIEATQPQVLASSRHYRYSPLSESFSAARVVPVIDGTRFDVSLLPWAHRQMFLFGASKIDTAYSGSVAFDRKRSTIEFDVQLPDSVRDVVREVHGFLLGVSGAPDTAVLLPPANLDRELPGRIQIQGSTQLSSNTPQPRNRAGSNEILFEVLGCRIGGRRPSTPVMMFVIDITDTGRPGMRLSSDDLSFQKVGRSRSSRSPWPTEQGASKTTTTFIRRLWVLEVPVTVR